MVLIKVFLFTLIFSWLVDIIDKTLKHFKIDDTHTPSVKSILGNLRL